MSDDEIGEMKDELYATHGRALCTLWMWASPHPWCICQCDNRGPKRCHETSLCCRAVFRTFPQSTRQTD